MTHGNIMWPNNLSLADVLPTTMQLCQDVNHTSNIGILCGHKCEQAHHCQNVNSWHRWCGLLAMLQARAVTAAELCCQDLAMQKRLATEWHVAGIRSMLCVRELGIVDFKLFKWPGELSITDTQQSTSFTETAFTVFRLPSQLACRQTWHFAQNELVN